MRNGYVLLEASVLTLVIALALAALMPVFILTVRANKASEKSAVSAMLSTELLEEIRLRRWDNKTPTPAQAVAEPSPIAVDPGKNASDKTTFTDIDDFNGWTESPPQDPVARPLAAFAGYTRDVSVSYVDENTEPAAGITAYKKVTVCTRAPASYPICLDTLFTNR